MADVNDKGFNLEGYGVSDNPVNNNPGNNPAPNGSLGFVSTTALHESGRTGVFLHGCKVYRIPDAPIKTQLPDTANNPTGVDLSYPDNDCTNYSTQFANPSNENFDSTLVPLDWIILHRFEVCQSADVEDGGEVGEKIMKEVRERFVLTDYNYSAASPYYASCCSTDEPFSLEVNKLYSGLKYLDGTTEQTVLKYKGMEYNPNMQVESILSYCDKTEVSDCEGSVIVLGGELGGKKWVNGKNRVTGKSNGTQSTIKAKEYSVSLNVESNISSANSLVPDVELSFSNTTVTGRCVSEQGYFDIPSGIETPLFEIELTETNDELFEVNPGASYIYDKDYRITNIQSIGVSDNVCQNLCDRKTVVEALIKVLTADIEELEAAKTKAEEQIKTTQEEIAEQNPPCDCTNPTTDACANLCKQLTDLIADLATIDEELEEKEAEYKTLNQEDAILAENVAATCPQGTCNPAAES